MTSRAPQLESQLGDDEQEREYTGCFEGPEKNLEVSRGEAMSASHNCLAA